MNQTLDLFTPNARHFSILRLQIEVIPQNAHHLPAFLGIDVDDVIQVLEEDLQIRHVQALLLSEEFLHVQNHLFFVVLFESDPLPFGGFEKLLLLLTHEREHCRVEHFQIEHVELLSVFLQCVQEEL